MANSTAVQTGNTSGPHLAARKVARTVSKRAEYWAGKSESQWAEKMAHLKAGCSAECWVDSKDQWKAAYWAERWADCLVKKRADMTDAPMVALSVGHLVVHWACYWADRKGGSTV